MNLDELDGRIGEGWSGEAPNGSHVNVVLARRGSPTAAAAICDARASRARAHAGARVRRARPQEYEPVWPPTLMMNKATAVDDRHQTMTWGAAQLGIAQGVLDAVADGLIEASGDLLVLVAVWVDPVADDETAVRVANRAATRKAIGVCVEGRDPAAAARTGRAARLAPQPVLQRRLSAHRCDRDAAVPLSARSAVLGRLGPRATHAPGRDDRRRPLRRRRRGLRERRRPAGPRAPRAAARRARSDRADTVHGILETVDFHHGRSWTSRSRSGISSGERAIEAALASCSAAEQRADRRLRVERRARRRRTSACAAAWRCATTGVRAVKLRLHSTDWRVDLPVIEAVREAVGSTSRSWSTRTRGGACRATSRRAGTSRPRRSSRGSSSGSASTGSRSRSPPTTSTGTRRFAGDRDPHRRRRDGALGRRGARARRARRSSTSSRPTSCSSAGIGGVRRDRGALRELNGRAWSAAHLVERLRAGREPPRGARVLERARIVEVPFDPPAWSAERRDWLLPVSARDRRGRDDRAARRARASASTPISTRSSSTGSADADPRCRPPPPAPAASRSRRSSSTRRRRTRCWCESRPPAYAIRTSARGR